MSRRDLLLISNLFPPEVLGGYELLARDVACALRARGHRVRVFTTGRAAAEDHPDVDRSLCLSRPFDERAARDRGRHLLTATHNGMTMAKFFMGASAPDGALVFSLRRLGLAPLRALRLARVPTVLTVNDEWPVAYVPQPGEPGLRGSLRLLLERSPLAAHTWQDMHWGATRGERVVWLSETVRSQVLARGAPLAAGVVCAQGVDLERFAFRGVREADRDAPRILFAGRLHPEKGPEVAIEALASLRRRGVAATLTLAGAPVDESYGRSLHALAQARDVAPHLRWLGAVDRGALPRLYAEADVFVFISRTPTEGLGLTWLEAMACGTPVVASPAGGAREFLERHGGADLVSDPSGEALADGVLRVLNDPDRQRALIERGHRVVREHACLDRYVDTLLAELER
jgi:glycogen(starch) synthase